MMESEVVARRGWLTRSVFLDQLGVVQLLPGPNSTELAIHVGHHLAGWRGGLLAGLCFVLPSVLLVWGIAAVSTGAAAQSLLAAVTWWLTPVILALLVRAAWSFGRDASARPGARYVMPAAAGAACALAGDLTVLLVGAGASLLVARRSTKKLSTWSLALLATPVLIGAGAALAQSGVSVLRTPGPLELFLYFLRAGVSVFGSGYVLFSFLRNDLVSGHQWLSLSELTQASALAQLTPGPLFTTATAAGFQIAGHTGALLATAGIFAPAFLSVWVSGPVRRLVKASPAARAALDGVVVASVILLGRAIVVYGWPMALGQWVLAALAGAILFGTRASSSLLLLVTTLVGLLSLLVPLSPRMPS